MHGQCCCKRTNGQPTILKVYITPGSLQKGLCSGVLTITANLLKTSYFYDSVLDYGPINHGLATSFLSQSYSERSQNAKFHPISHHLAIIQTRPSPPILGFVDKVLARFNYTFFNSHITGRKNFVMFVISLLRHMFFWVKYFLAGYRRCQSAGSKRSVLPVKTLRLAIQLVRYKTRDKCRPIRAIGQLKS